MRKLALVAVFIGLIAVGGCAAKPPTSPTSTIPNSPVRPAPGGALATATSPSPTARPLAGKVVVIDAGHTGGWSSAWGTHKVPNGTGGTKPCNSSGTATRSGYAEHSYNFDQADALANALRTRGATVLLNRSDDTTATDELCVNHRADKANERAADLLISLHADGNVGSGHRGFHIIVSTAMKGGTAVIARSKALAKDVRHSLESQTDLPRSNYIGGGSAYSFRSDIATLNFSERPAVMMELGNMMNASDAAAFSSPRERKRIAQALADGIQEFLDSAR